MTTAHIQSGIYAGDVVHQRFAPRPHRLKYSIFQVLLDLDRIDDDLSRLKSFSRNRFNLFGFYDRDHGPDQAETDAPLKDCVRRASTASMSRSTRSTRPRRAA